MLSSFVLATLVVSGPIASFAGAPPVLDASALSKPPSMTVGAVIGVVVADATVSISMLALASNDAGRDVIGTLRSGGALPFVVGASLVTVGVSGVGAGVGHVAAGGEVSGSPGAVAGAMLGALVGTVLAAAPGLWMLDEADRLAQTEAQSFGDAIGLGIAGGFNEGFGLVWVAVTPLLVAPLATGGAFAGASLAGVE